MATRKKKGRREPEQERGWHLKTDNPSPENTPGKEESEQEKQNPEGTVTGRISGSGGPSSGNTPGREVGLPPGFQEGYCAAERHEREAKEQEARFEAMQDERALSTVIIEFGDGQVTLRDGLGRMFARGSLQGWTRFVGAAMAARGCKHIGTRIGEHALFSIRDAEQLKERETDEALRRDGLKPGMLWESDEFKE